MTKRELLQRIEALEKRVRALESPPLHPPLRQEPAGFWTAPEAVPRIATFP